MLGNAGNGGRSYAESLECIVVTHVWRFGYEPRRLNQITQIDTIELIGTIGTASAVETSPQIRVESTTRENGLDRWLGVMLALVVAGRMRDRGC